MRFKRGDQPYERRHSESIPVRQGAVNERVQDRIAVTINDSEKPAKSVDYV